MKEISVSQLTVSDIGHRAIVIDAAGNAYDGILDTIRASAWKYGKTDQDKVRTDLTLTSGEQSELKLATLPLDFRLQVERPADHQIGGRVISEKLRTLAEAHEAVNKIVSEVAGLLGVAAIDVLDLYDDDTLPRTLFLQPVEGGGDRPTPLARRFARMLVERLLYEPEIELDYRAPDRENGDHDA